jgi:hypothetical protein
VNVLSQGSSAAATAMRRATSLASAPSQLIGRASSARTATTSAMELGAALSLFERRLLVVTGATLAATRVLQVDGRLAELTLLLLRRLLVTGLMSLLQLPTAVTLGAVLLPPLGGNLVLSCALANVSTELIWHFATQRSRMESRSSSH